MWDSSVSASHSPDPPPRSSRIIDDFTAVSGLYVGSGYSNSSPQAYMVSDFHSLSRLLRLLLSVLNASVTKLATSFAVCINYQIAYFPV